MADSPLRRTSRKRKANPRYSDTVSHISLSSNESETSAKTSTKENEDKVSEFDEGAAVLEEEEDAFVPDEDADVNASEEDEQSSEEERDDDSIVGSDVHHGGEERDDVSDAESEGDPLNDHAPKHLKKRVRNDRVKVYDPKLLPAFDERVGLSDTNIKHFRRGILDLTRHGKRKYRLKYSMGLSDEDLIPFIKARDKWQNDFTLPSRRRRKDGSGGMAESFYRSPEMRQKELTEGWDWYERCGARDRFARGQSVQPISITDAKHYISQLSNAPQNFVMGPYNKQKLFSLGFACRMSLGDAWDTDSQDSTTSNDGQSGKDASRNGWILNAGARVHCIEWVPNQGGRWQYLSITVLGKDPHARTNASAERFKNPKAPAFTAAEPYPASMQIWRIQASDVPKEEGTAGTMDTEYPPELDTILCFDWCDIKQFKWCPMPHSHSQSAQDQDQRHLGLLAGVWFDGHVRVFDITLPPATGKELRCLYISKSAFSTTFPDTLPICVCWLSTMSIAVGCANGNVAIFHLPSTLSTSDGSSKPRPWFYANLHSSYINSLLCGYPSRPYLLITVSMDGYIRITDVRAHDVDYVFGPRLRVGPSTLAWHEVTQCTYSTDDAGIFRGYAIRRAFATLEFIRLSSQATDIATSPVHPCILVAQQDGNVICTNPLNRVMGPKASLFRQTWFEWTWRRGRKDGGSHKYNAAPGSGDPNQQNGHDKITATNESTEVSRDNGAAMEVDSTRTEERPNDTEPVSNASASTTPNPILERPLGRFLEGHKVEEVAGIYINTADEARFYATIYEENTAITRVAWNPNVKYGGWAAAGTGSGLVRVEDIAIDVPLFQQSKWKKHDQIVRLASQGDAS